jgi:hypothetical protein
MPKTLSDQMSSPKLAWSNSMTRIWIAGVPALNSCVRTFGPPWGRAPDDRPASQASWSSRSLHGQAEHGLPARTPGAPCWASVLNRR